MIHGCARRHGLVAEGNASLGFVNEHRVRVVRYNALPEETMGYAGEIIGAQAQTLDRYARGINPGPANGRQSPLRECTERAEGIANELRELIGRGHQTLDRIAGPMLENAVVTKPGGIGPIDKEPAQLRQLENAILSTGGAIDPLRHLINRLEAL